MNIGQAIEALKDGKKLRRRGWNDGNNVFIVIIENICKEIFLFIGGEKRHSYHASQSDLLAEDWEAIE